MTRFQPTRRLFQSLLAAALGLTAMAPALAQKTIEMRYGHMNPPTSAAGMQAQWLADAIAKNSSGQIKVTVYPSSQLGKLHNGGHLARTRHLRWSTGGGRIFGRHRLCGGGDLRTKGEQLILHHVGAEQEIP